MHTRLPGPGRPTKPSAGPSLLAGHQRAVSAQGTSSKRSDDAASSDLPAAVLSYLRYWQLCDVALVDSRRRWLADWKKTICIVGHCRETADRLALCDYLLTGQLPGLGAYQLVGSVVMFANPPRSKGGAERALDECFLEALLPEELFAARQQHQQQQQPGKASSAPAGASASSASNQSSSSSNKKNNKKKGAAKAAANANAAFRNGSSGSNITGGQNGSTGGPQQQVDIVAAGVELLRRRVRRLGSLLATGRVEVQVQLRLVEPRDTATAGAISALRPASISWSNVPDYYSPAAFHRLARACSVAPPRGHPSIPTAGAASTALVTTHYVTSMNWAMDVKGACHLDVLMPYQEPVGAKARCGGGRGPGKHPPPPRAVSDMILKLMAEGENAVQGQLEQFGMGGRGGGGLIFFPPVDNPRNVTDFALMTRTYQAWVDAFLRAGGVRPSPASAAGRGARPEVVAPPIYSPLSRTNSTISLAYTYDGRE